MATPSSPVEDVIRSLGECLLPLGFEVYPLKVVNSVVIREAIESASAKKVHLVRLISLSPNTEIAAAVSAWLSPVGWYNAVLSESFHLPYPDDTLAVVVLSAPGMFEKAFIPFLEMHSGGGLHHDYIDQCTAHCITSAVTTRFPGQQVDISYDYEMHPNRKPKFLAQSAAHVAGAAYYYQQSDVPDQPWGKKKMFGVCIHPRLGGWFAIRALLVFRDVQAGPGELQQPPVPQDCVRSREERVELLERFNLRWQDGTYRDIIPVEDSYSQQQRKYFNTPPGGRLALLKQWGYLTTTEAQTDTTQDCELSHG